MGQTVFMTLCHFVPVLIKKNMREEENGGRQIRGEIHPETE